MKLRNRECLCVEVGRYDKKENVICRTLVFYLIMPLKSKVQQNVFICIGE